MKCGGYTYNGTTLRRSSHEERGLKFSVQADSLPDQCRRSSHEERGLKYDGNGNTFAMVGGRSSHEERGLKYERAHARLVAVHVSLLA